VASGPPRPAPPRRRQWRGPLFRVGRLPWRALRPPRGNPPRLRHPGSRYQRRPRSRHRLRPRAESRSCPRPRRPLAHASHPLPPLPPSRSRRMPVGPSPPRRLLRTRPPLSRPRRWSPSRSCGTRLRQRRDQSHRRPRPPSLSRRPLSLQSDPSAPPWLRLPVRTQARHRRPIHLRSPSHPPPRPRRRTRRWPRRLSLRRALPSGSAWPARSCGSMGRGRGSPTSPPPRSPVGLWEPLPSASSST